MPLYTTKHAAALAERQLPRTRATVEHGLHGVVRVNRDRKRVTRVSITIDGRHFLASETSASDHYYTFSAATRLLTITGRSSMNTYTISASSESTFDPFTVRAESYQDAANRAARRLHGRRCCAHRATGTHNRSGIFQSYEPISPGANAFMSIGGNFHVMHNR